MKLFVIGLDHPRPTDHVATGIQGEEYDVRVTQFVETPGKGSRGNKFLVSSLIKDLHQRIRKRANQMYELFYRNLPCLVLHIQDLWCIFLIKFNFFWEL